MTTTCRALASFTLGAALALTFAVLTSVAEDDGFIPVESTVIDSVKYDASTHVLALRLDDGEEIRFMDVPKKVYAEFMDVRTKGGFVKGRLVPDYKSESSFDDVDAEAAEEGAPATEGDAEAAPVEAAAAPVAVEEPPATEPLSVDTTKPEVVENGDLPAAAPEAEAVAEEQGEDMEDVLKQAVDEAAAPVPEPAMETAVEEVAVPEPEVVEPEAEVEAAVEEAAAEVEAAVEEPEAEVEAAVEEAVDAAAVEEAAAEVEAAVPEPEAEVEAAVEEAVDAAAVEEAAAEVETAVEAVAVPEPEGIEPAAAEPAPALQANPPTPSAEQAPAVSTDETDVLEDLLDELK